MKRIMTEPASHGAFWRCYVAESVRESGDHAEIEADASECAALAAELGLVAITRLKATFALQRRGRAGLRVTGRLDAMIAQTCVVSLEAFDSHIEESIESSFAPEPDARASENRLAQEARLAGADGLVLSETPDPPDLIVNGLFDLGALAAEYLALALDPYPRKPGAVFAEVIVGNDEETIISPFAVLANAAGKKESGGKL